MFQCRRSPGTCRRIEIGECEEFFCFTKHAQLSLFKQAKKIQTLDISQAKGPIEDVLNSLAFLPYLRVLNLSDLHVI